MSELISLVDGATAGARRAYRFTSATAWTETFPGPGTSAGVGFALPENDDLLVVRSAITAGSSATPPRLQFWRYDVISERWYKCTIRSITEGDEVGIELNGTANGFGVQCKEMGTATEVSVWIERRASAFNRTA